MNIIKKLHILSQKHFPFLSKNAALIIGAGLPTILLYLIAFLITALSTPDIPGYILAKTHFSFLEHIVMSATIIVIGAALIDTEEKRQEREKSEKK